MKATMENYPQNHKKFISERGSSEGREKGKKIETIKNWRHNVIQINGKGMKRTGCVYAEQT